MILSNYSPEECYSKCSLQQLAPLLDRLEYVEVDRFIRIEKQEDEPEEEINVIDDA